MPSSQISISTTLLARLRKSDPNAWCRLTRIYGPLVYGWCRQNGLSPEDAADIGQEVFRSVAQGLGRFRRDRPGDSFRGWLATITRNKIRDHFRHAPAHVPAIGGTDFRRQLEHATAPVDSLQIARRADTVRSEQRQVLHRALQLLQAEFEPTTWQAFWHTAVEYRPPADVAADLGLSLNAVYKAKSRVLRRIRDELDGLAL